mmetsp:Transcript_13537/g.25886  ORF Transcript_13537/g.25886 Transcript_13537/m.25886 type:complete len:406 (+) Transcript_13537:457-1674(+)|eukprot:CAMPEP_0114225810 /NCGR_PEP_ID=MMETSP0058-20121206/880_1 /TAXON_ID=36894 /ORGANISM="Pyramimonas parkeae, CCMP726" /LENGTH=405 /DNA_ID=CAMNT_0001336459 /DNA_START=366 /DNA_END=1583 /DNA_ORIENTATION=+
MGRARTATGKRNRSVTFLSSFSTHRHQVVAPVRAANGSAFTACAACKKSVPFALLDFHNRECEELAGSLEAHCQASGNKTTAPPSEDDCTQDVRHVQRAASDDRMEAMEANLAEALAELARTREENARALGMLAEVQHHLKATLQREQQANSEIERLQALVARRGALQTAAADSLAVLSPRTPAARDPSQETAPHESAQNSHITANSSRVPAHKTPLFSSLRTPRLDQGQCEGAGLASGRMREQGCPTNVQAESTAQGGGAERDGNPNRGTTAQVVRRRLLHSNPGHVFDGMSMQGISARTQDVEDTGENIDPTIQNGKSDGCCPTSETRHNQEDVIFSSSDDDSKDTVSPFTTFTTSQLHQKNVACARRNVLKDEVVSDSSDFDDPVPLSVIKNTQDTELMNEV